MIVGHEAETFVPQTRQKLPCFSLTLLKLTHRVGHESPRIVRRISEIEFSCQIR